MKLLELVAEFDDGVLLADGLDGAFVGLAYTQSGMVAVYSVERVLDILCARGATTEEAQEHFDFNVLGAYVGPRTPIYIMEIQAESEQ